jgi:hypothetical protein
MDISGSCNAMAFLSDLTTKERHHLSGTRLELRIF